MAAFSNFRPLVPDEECLEANNTMSGDGGTTFSDDGISFRLRRQQQSNESHSGVLSPIGYFEQTDSDVTDQEEFSEGQESGILVRFVEGRDTMYGAPNACSTGLSLLQPEIIDTLNSFVPKMIKELGGEDTAGGFPGFSTIGTSPLSQYTIDSSSSAESLTQHSFLPRSANVGDSRLSSTIDAGNRDRREVAVGMCSSEDASSHGVRNLLRMSEGNFNESHLSQFPLSSEASGESPLSQYPCSSYEGGASCLSPYPMSSVSGLIQDFDMLIQGSAGGGVKASHLTVVDAFPAVATSVGPPQFTVIDAYVGDTETGRSESRDNFTELPQFTIVDTFVDDGVPANMARHESPGQRCWPRAQFDVVDAVVGSLGSDVEMCPRVERLVTAECKTVGIADEDALRLERPPSYPLKPFETCRTQAVASVNELHKTAGLETYTCEEPKEPEPSLYPLKPFETCKTRPVASVNELHKAAGLETYTHKEPKEPASSLYPIKSFETCKTRPVASVNELHQAAGLETYTYKEPKEPEPSDLQQVTVSATARPAACSVTTLPESGDCQLFATASVARPVMFPDTRLTDLPAAAPQLMSGDMMHAVATSATISTVPPALPLLMSRLPQTSAGVTSHLVSCSQPQVVVMPDSKFAAPPALQQPLSSNVSHLNSTCGSKLVASSVQSTTVDRSSGVDASHPGNEAGNVRDEAGHLLPPRIPVVKEPEQQGSLAEMQEKEVRMQLQFDEEMSELEKTISASKNERHVAFSKPLECVLSGYQNLPWMALKAGQAQLTSDLICPQSTSIVGLPLVPFDINRTENSLRLSMDVLQMSIGDTLIHTGRAPLGSSTPIAKEDKLTMRRLQAMQTIQDSEERSDSGRASRASTSASAEPELEPAKLGAKSGSDVEYMPAEERRRLLDPSTHDSFERNRTEDGELGRQFSNQNNASAGHLKNIVDKAETEICSHTMQNRSKGVGEELNVGSGPKSRDAGVCENAMEMQRNVELEWVEKLSGRRSRTASSSGCSLGDSAPDFKAPTEPGPSTGICDRLSSHSGSFEDLRITFKRREPLGEERKDVKESPQAFAEAVRAEGGGCESWRDSERDSCSEGSDIEKVHKLYRSCLRENDDPGTSEEESDKVEEKGGDEAGEKHREEEVEKSSFPSKNLTIISESREDLRSIQPFGGLYSTEQKSDVKPVFRGESAAVLSDNDSLASSLPRSSVSGSDIEDGLSEDVKRILAKYGRRFSSLKSDDAEKPEAEIRYKSNDGKHDQLESRPPSKFDDKLSARSEDETSGNEEACLANRNSKSGSLRSGDFQEKVSTAPAEVTEPSKTHPDNAEKSILRNESSIRASTLRRLVEPTVESSGESSDDTLGRRVNELLAKTDRMLGRHLDVTAMKSPTRHSSVASSQAGSVDYGILQKDLDELEMSLDSMKKGDFVSHFTESRTDKQPLSQLTSGAEMTGSRVLHTLLMSGLVPVDVTLDMVHGSTDDLSDDGSTRVFGSGLGRAGISEAEQDAIRARVNAETFDDKSDFTDKTSTRIEEVRCVSDVDMLDGAVTTQSGFSAPQSCLTDEGKSKTLEASMEEWSRNHISSFPEMLVLVDDDGSSRSRGSLQENVTTRRGSSHGSRSSNVSQMTGLRDSVEANITVGRGSNSFRESITKILSTDVGPSSERKDVRGVTDGKDNQSSGYSGSGSLPTSDTSLGLRVVKADQTGESSLKTFSAGRPLTSIGLRPVQGGVSPIERPAELKSQSEIKRNQLVNENIDRDSYFDSSLSSVGSSKSVDRGRNGDARMSKALVSGYEGPLNSQLNQAGSAPIGLTLNSQLNQADSAPFVGTLNSQSNQVGNASYTRIPNSVSAGFQPNKLKQLMRDSDVTVPQHRTLRSDSELSGIQKRYDDSENENLSHNESNFTGSGINLNENNIRATPVSEIHELDSFEDTTLISAVEVHRARLKHDRAKCIGQQIEGSDCESAEGEWTEQFLDGVEPDAYYLSESMLDSGDDQFSSSGNIADLSGGLVISPLRKHSPFKASKSVQLLLSAQLNRVRVSNYETGLHPPLNHPVTNDTHHEKVSSSIHDLDNVSGDSSGTLVVNDSSVAAVADETLKPIVEGNRSKVEDYPSDQDSQANNSREEQSSSSAMQHTSLTTVTSLRDSTDCENNLEFPNRRDNRSASTSPTIVPYRPVNSRDVYYVDSGTEDGSLSAGHSEAATIESSHAGSDDARAPNFPAEVLGTRSDAPMDAMRSSTRMMPSSVSKPTDLSTIEELSVVQTSSSDRHMSDNSAASKSNLLMEKSRKKEFEQSLEKTRNWVSGISSSLPDMCTPSKVHRTSLSSLSDSNILPVGSREGQAAMFPDCGPFKVGGGQPRSLHGKQIRKTEDAVDFKALPSGVNGRTDGQLKKGVIERASKGTGSVSTAGPNMPADRGLPLSRATTENRPLPPSVGISTELDKRLHCEPCSMPTFASNQSEFRSMDFEVNAANERTVDPIVNPDDHLQSLPPSSAALDHFVSDRFTRRFESHYGLTPAVQSIVEQYADEKDMKRKAEVEAELNRTHTMHESPFRSSKDLSGAAAGEGVRHRERMEQLDLLPSKSLDSSLKMTSLSESPANHVSKSRSNTLPGQAAEVLMGNSENLPESGSRFSKDAFVSRLWEKFHESGASGSSESESSSRRAEVSALQLVSLVNNPVKHIVEHLQRERAENRQTTDEREAGLDQSVSHARMDEGTSLRSADSYQTYIMDTGRRWDLAREAAAGKDGERPTGSCNGQGTSRKGAGDQSSPSTVRGNRGSGRGLLTSGAGEKSSSDDEHEENRRKFIHGDFGKADVLRKLLEKDEREKQKREEGRSAPRSHQQQTVSKRAWIIQDEVLPAVPENRTIDSITSEFTSSSVDESGKVVTRTTKRHLPGDPKLLKLQQKIARQKEKYKQAYFREHRRKEKIAQLEMLYLMKQSETGVEPVTVGSSLDSFSQPPSVGPDSTPQNITSDNSAFCFNCSETDGSACICVRLKSNHPALQQSLPEDIAHGIKMRKSSPTKKRGGKSAPVIALELREVDYSEDDRGRKDEHIHSKRVCESHPRTVSPPKRSSKVISPKSSAKKITHASSPDGKTPSFVVPMESSRAFTVSPGNDPSSPIQRKLKSKSVDFGMNFPTPRHEIRRSLRSKGVQTTPRLEDPALPLDARSCVSERRPYRGSRPYDVGVISIPVRGRVRVKAPRSGPHATHGTFVSESRDHEWHQQTKSSHKGKSHKVKPRKSFPRGIAWFVPLSKATASLKSQQPLRYTDLYEMHRMDTLDRIHTVDDNCGKDSIVHLDQSGATVVKDSSMDFVGSRTMYKESASTALKENADNFKKLSSHEVFLNSTEGFSLARGHSLGPSLQELFRSNMQAFISRSREREKHIALRAEERTIQVLHAKERLQLFGSLSRGSSILHTDPVCEQLFKPRKRWFTKQEMRMMTNKRYRNLPEVMKMVEQRQKTERSNANRQRVQMFKQKILSHVLSEKNRRTAA